MAVHDSFCRQCLLYVTADNLVSHRKKLLTSNSIRFVHLNLAITLFLAYLTFVVGVELARDHKVSGGYVFCIMYTKDVIVANLFLVHVVMKLQYGLLLIPNTTVGYPIIHIPWKTYTYVVTIRWPALLWQHCFTISSWLPSAGCCVRD